MNKKRLYQSLVYHQKEFGKNGSGLKYQKTLELINSGQRVLEIGCHTGTLGKELQKMGCSVWGIEINDEAARQAEPFYEKMLAEDIEEENVWNQLPRQFDVILLLDVLEHTIDPWNVLRECKKRLKPEGFILVTLPNIAFYSIRRGLLFGKFDYRESGILDKTHLRYFTFDSAMKLFKDCGFTVQHWDATVSELPLEHRWRVFQSLYDRLRPVVARKWPNLFGAVIFYRAICK